MERLVFAITPAEWVLLVVWAIGIVAAAYATWGEVPLARRILPVAAAVFVPVVGSISAFVLAFLRFRRNRSTGLENEELPMGTTSSAVARGRSTDGLVHTDRRA
ncbi:hypothetical protein ACIGB8_14995 [Promicromonospora sukumoe]|uniref:hypothetical protein n=1 Tax=Promicromonospora sukumoe TaxID=88382 RepID=UPI0037CC6497